MNNNQKILIGVIIILLLLLIGAYAISQNNNGAAAPTPTPTPTPTPNPSGSGDGQGTGTQATPTPAPVATPTPAPVATPTPAPTLVPGLTTDPEPGSYWPYYDYNWSASSGPHELANVSFISQSGGLWYHLEDDVFSSQDINYDGFHFGYEVGGSWTDGDISIVPGDEGSIVVIRIPVVRDGDLSSSYTVSIEYQLYSAEGDPVVFIDEATFTPGNGVATLDVGFDPDVVLTGDYFWMDIEILDSPDYLIGDGPNFYLYVND